LVKALVARFSEIDYRKLVGGFLKQTKSYGLKRQFSPEAEGEFGIGQP